jgi:hypothetical protein
VTFIRSIAIALLVFAWSAPAGAITILLNVSIDGTQAGTGSLAIGSAMLWLDTDTNVLAVDMTYSGLSSPTNDAHIHCCSPPGTSSGVIIPFAPPFVTGLTSGSMTASFALTPSQATQVVSGGSYINIHTDNFPVGEIRGQIPVPEPGSLVLLGVGLAGVIAATRRKRSAA